MGAAAAAASRGGTAAPNLVAKPASHSRPTRLFSQASIRSVMRHASRCLHCSAEDEVRGEEETSGESVTCGYRDLVPLCEDAEGVRRAGAIASS